MEHEQEFEGKKLAHYRETMDRLTAASHVKVEYFAEHQKIEGYYEDRMPERLFGCDRLMKQDNLFGTIQLGYNPNRERTFLFANLKTSRYDTVASRYQKEMREYRMRSLLKGDNENRAYVSRRDEMSSILIEKKERKPWSIRSVKTYLSRVNMETAAKLLPFFSREEESEELKNLYGRRKEIQSEIRSLRSRERSMGFTQEQKQKEELQNIPLFIYLSQNYPDTLKQLQISSVSNRYPFMNLLSNMKKSNLELPAISAGADVETAQNIHGTKLTYRGTSYASDDGYDFSIEFDDTKFLDVYMLLKAFDEYENRKTYGQISIPLDFIRDKVLHDQFSIYKFILDEDFETIVYWAKLTGCYFKNVPRDTFSDLPETGGLSYSVQFHAQFIEDMKPEILDDFNHVTERFVSGRSKVDLYDSEIQASNPDWCYIPYIVPRSRISEPIARPALQWYL